MASYVDLSSLHSPVPRAKPSAAWGAQIRENFEFLHDNRRVVCTSSSRPGTPFEGLEIYETDTDRTYIYDGSSWVQTGGVGAWISYTPTLVQSSAVTKTVSYAKYQKDGRQIVGNVLMLVTGSGTSGQPIIVGMPYEIAGSGNLVLGSGWIYDASGVVGYTGALIRVSSSSAILWANGETNNIGADPAFGLANSDQISYEFNYEATT